MAVAAFGAAVVFGCGRQATPPGGADAAANSDGSIGAPNTALSLWSTSTMPTSFASDDGSAIELGVKFRASVAGSVVGVRFYKGADNTGTHVGHLWTAAGSLLGTAAFADETATGWQTAYFASTIPIDSGAIYVVSYFAPNGHYAGEDGYFEAGRTAGPLYALSDGESGGNGVYVRGAAGGFPTASFNANNYYVDPLFLPESSGNDDGQGIPAPTCTPSCAGRQCGPDGCGGSCGACGAGQSCNASGQCVASTCTPACSGKQCGPNGCGGSCGACGAGQGCNASGQCVASTCTPACSGKQCGPDDCGGICGTCTVGKTCSAAGQCQTTPPFNVIAETYDGGTGDSNLFKTQALADGVDWHPEPSLQSAQRSWLLANGFGFAYHAVPAGAGLGNCGGYTYDSSESVTAAILSSMSSSLGLDRVWRLGMPEWDQGGGCWTNGRPGLWGMTNANALAAYKEYYLNRLGFGAFLGQTAQQRGYKWMSISAYGHSPHFAAEWGADTVLIERGNDEVDGLNPGLAIVRGAGRQYGREWGTDFSYFKTWNAAGACGATGYNSGNLKCGWSTATYKRQHYMAYMSGANIILDEAVGYVAGAAPNHPLNPLGETIQAFRGFAKNAHPNRGAPWVPFAIMRTHDNGWIPDFGEWTQGGYRWHGGGSGMIQTDPEIVYYRNLLLHVFPNYWTWGTLPPATNSWIPSSCRLPNGRISPSCQGQLQGPYQAQLGGSDAESKSRSWEPMGATRYGETFDVITNRASSSVLSNYRAVIVAKGSALTSGEVSALDTFAQAGGIVVLRAAQLAGGATDALAGLSMTGATGTTSSAVWNADSSAVSDSSYTYAKVSLTTAAAVAHSGSDPVVTKSARGAGAVYVVLNTDLRVLNIDAKLIAALHEQVTGVPLVRVSGPTTEWLASVDANNIIVTIVNTQQDASNNPLAAAWTGSLSFPVPAGSYAIKDWTNGDAVLSSTVSGGRVAVEVTVPAYDVKVIALERAAGP
jgi:hypothetical protein